MRIQGLAIVMVLSLLLPPAQAAILLVPANAQEIASVLGPDARGLHLRAAALPDLFTLTASRLDEDPKTFIVEQPYVSGHWQGGKAIIEYARDLSYTQVSIYDRNGNRQRIYSVRSKLEERTPPPVLVIPEIDAPFDKTPPPALSVNAPGDRPRRRHAVAVEEAAPDQPVVPVVAALPMTTPVTIVEPTPILVPVPKAVPVAPPPMATPKAVSKPVPKENPKPVVVVETPLPPPAPAVKSTQPPAVSEPITEETMGEGTHYEWDEAKGAYIPVNVKIIAPATPTSAPKVTVTAAAPAPMPVESSAHRAPAQTVGPPIDLHPAPESNENWAAISEDLAQHALVTVAAKPGKRPTKAVSVAPVAAVVSVVPVALPTPSPVATPAPIVSPEETTLAAVPHPAAQSVSAVSALPKSAPVSVPSPVVVPVAAPVTPSPGRKGARGHGEFQTAQAQVVVTSADAYDLPADEKPVPTSSRKSKGSSSGAASASVPAAVSVAVPEHVESAVAPAHTAAPVVLESPVPAAAAPAANDNANVVPAANAPANSSLDSDDWVPKNNKPTAEDIAIPALKPKAKATSIDDLMQIASVNQGAVPNEANVWVPRNTTLPAPDADIHDELSRVRGKRKVAPKVVPKINRDINNPEEGVLPANSFEKFSGSRYGRHREYERRLSFTKKANAPLSPKSYDFIVDEVDRKKEFHNVYFYTHEAKGKPPRLIAVEKHERVTFMSNYDVDKEDKGKLTKY
jgi:hypothetical protein